MGEWVRWAVAMTVYPFLLASDIAHDLKHWRENERLIREARQRFLATHEGE